MSHISVLTLAIVSIAVTTCRALPDIHTQMSAQQLQSVFQVASPEAVPQYEVIQLLHDHSEEGIVPQYNNYRRRKRSIESSSGPSVNHVKKDLSKTPYYSDPKAETKSHANSLNDNETIKPVKHIKEHKVTFDAFGQKLNLTLKKTQGLFKRDELHKLPMWFMDNEVNSTQDINLEKIEDELLHSSEHIGEVFQDEENMAAILMRRHEITGDLVMEGSVGHDMVIKPLPHDLSPNPEESHHVIYKRSADSMEHLSDFAFMEPDDVNTHEKLEKLQERHKRSAHLNTLADIEEERERLEAEDDLDADETLSHRRAKRQAPYMIYPEILVIVDYDGYRLHGGDNLQVKRYFIAFWNGVDLRYRLLKEPKIRVSIAGIIISRGRDATPYLERNRVGRDAIDSAAALTDMGKYLFRERRLPVYDIAVAITKYDMCRRRKGGRCTKGTAGFAYVGGACVVNRRLEKVNSVAIIEDTGGFSGIIVAAHEVGHLLGAVHDGSPPPSYLGGPGAQRCRWEDGFIMSDLRHTERGFRWSACSVQSFQHFLNGATATCLYNVPHEDNALGRSLPGTLLSLDAQCRRDRGTYACFKDERVCAQLFCFDAQTGYCVAYRPAAEGSTCGNNLHCLDGRCTPLQVASNLISNYGPNYRLGYKSNEDSSEENESKTKESKNINSKEEDDDDDDDDDGDDDDDDEEDDDTDNYNNNDNEDIQKQRKLNKTSSSEEVEDDEDNDDEEDEDEDEGDDSPTEELENEENSSDSLISKGRLNNNNNNNNNASPFSVNTENDDDEGYLSEDNNQESLPKILNKLYDYNRLDKPNDNRYEETMVKRNDNDNDNESPKPVFNLNTYQYLSQLWQNLQTQTQPTTTTTTTTTKRPVTVLQQHHQQDFKTINKSFQTYGGLKLKPKSNLQTSARNAPPYHNTDTITSTTATTSTTLKPRTPKHLNTTPKSTPHSTPPTSSTFINTLRKQFQYYVKLLQTNSDSSRSTSPRYSATTLYNHNIYNSHNVLPPPSKPYSNSLNNAATKHLHNNKPPPPNSQHNNNDGDDEEDNEDNEDNDDDSGDDNDESNETIEKQKRKLNLPKSTTTSMQQQQQQQLQLQVTPPNPTTTTNSQAAVVVTASAALEVSASTPAPLLQYGVKSSVGYSVRSLTSPSIYDLYVKKLQALNAQSLVGTTTEAAFSSGTRSTEDGYARTLDKTEKSAPTTISQYEGQYLKRTLGSSPTLSSFSSSVSNKNPYTKSLKSTAAGQTSSATITTSSSGSGSGSSSSSSSSYKHIPSSLKIQIPETDTPPQQTSQTSPSYVTNYIGDNTQRLASVVQQHEQQQHFQQQPPPNSNSHQQQQQQQQHASPNHHHRQQQQQHPEHSAVVINYATSSSSSTTRRPKIKTQKLIRRLRTQNK